MMQGFAADQLSLWGWAVLAALALVSVSALTASLFKLFHLARLGVGRRALPNQIVDRWLAGAGDAALELAERRSSALVRVLFAALSGLKVRPGDKVYARELATQTALDELADMERGMRTIEATVQAAPMLGLLGTVVGMIEAFGRLAQATGAADPALLAGGIWTALLTTAVGLAIAILFYFVSLWLEARIARERAAMERVISAVLNGRVDARPGDVSRPVV
jgi:biopolymer transport protein ExbB